MVRQYVGARYVPMFYENPDDSSNHWKAGIVYDPLTIVTDANQSYTSKKAVPANIGRPSENREYWILTGAYNAQIEQYRNEVAALAEDVAALSEASSGYTRSRSSGVSQIGVYDTGLSPEGNGLQGAWADGNIWYEYIYQSGISGKLYSFNMATGRFINSIDADLYHGNDFVKCGNYVYGAPYDDGLGSGVNDILRFIPGGTVERISVFNPTGYDCLYGIDKIDEETLICALRPYGTNTVDSTAFYLYHIITGTIEPVTVAWNNLVQGQNSFPHPMTYSDGKLYLTTSGENGVFVLEYKNRTLNCISYNAIPLYTAGGNIISELEGVGFVERYGNKYLIFTATTALLEVSILFCGINLTGNSPAYLVQDRIPSVEQNSVVLSYSDPDLIYETGLTYPVKRLYRACAMANFNWGGDVDGNVVLPSEVNEPAAELRIVYKCALVAPTGGCVIAKPIRFIRAHVFMSGGPFTFNGNVTIQSNSKITFSQADNVFGTMRIAQSECNECQPNSHTDQVTLDGANYKMSIRATETPNVRASNSTIIQVNKTDSTGIAAGGGTTVLLAGVK